MAAWLGLLSSYAAQSQSVRFKYICCQCKRTNRYIAAWIDRWDITSRKRYSLLLRIMLGPPLFRSCVKCRSPASSECDRTGEVNFPCIAGGRKEKKSNLVAGLPKEEGPIEAELPQLRKILASYMPFSTSPLRPSHQLLVTVTHT